MSDATGRRADRRLPALLAALGFTLALAACFVVDLIITLSSEPTRINFAYVGEEGSSVSFLLDISMIAVLLAVALAGALLGWWAGIAAARRGWRISRGDGG